MDQFKDYSHYKSFRVLNISAEAFGLQPPSDAPPYPLLGPFLAGCSQVFAGCWELQRWNALFALLISFQRSFTVLGKSSIWKLSWWPLLSIFVSLRPIKLIFLAIVIFEAFGFFFSHAYLEASGINFSTLLESFLAPLGPEALGYSLAFSGLLVPHHDASTPSLSTFGPPIVRHLSRLTLHQPRAPYLKQELL